MHPASIIVLGMHRSGTSCLTGNLEQAGVFLGKVNRKAPYNARGNQENRQIMDLNDAVLGANGASWDNPPCAPTLWGEEHRSRRDRILAEYPVGRTIGFKEPRTLFTLEGWLEALPRCRLVGTVRHPYAVAESLHARNGFPHAQGHELWLKYNRRLLEVCSRYPMPLIDFDASVEQYMLALGRLCRKLALEPPASGFDFFEPGLRHIESPRAPPSEARLRDVYDALLSMTV